MQPWEADATGMIGRPCGVGDGVAGTRDGIGRRGIEFVQVEFRGIQKFLQGDQELRCGGHEPGMVPVEPVHARGHGGENLAR